jgi:D-arabinose 1-dehydrogenase-like Zn-dependent alcohol dehydrogenase
MGGIHGEIAIPYVLMVLKSLQVRGRMMHTRETMMRLIKMVEGGNIVLGEKAGMKTVGSFGLDGIQKAFEMSERHTGWSNLSVLTP